jgi:hypothetical protein
MSNGFSVGAERVCLIWTAVVKNLPHIAASRKRCWRFSRGVAGAYKGGRRIDNPPQITNLPHKRGEEYDG